MTHFTVKVETLPAGKVLVICAHPVEGTDKACCVVLATATEMQEQLDNVCMALNLAFRKLESCITLTATEIK